MKKGVVLGSIFVITLVIASGFGSTFGTTEAVTVQSYNDQSIARKFYFGNIVIMFNGNSGESYATIYPNPIPDPLYLNSAKETLIFQVNVSMDLWGLNDWGEVSATVWVNGSELDTYGHNTDGNWDGSFTWTIDCFDGTLIEWYLYAHGHDLFFDKYDDYSGSTTCNHTPSTDPHAVIHGAIRGTVDWENQPKTCEDEFEICNDGDPGSVLYWELLYFPTFGSEWSISPIQGSLQAGECTTVSVSFLSPIGVLYDEWDDPLVLSTNAPGQGEINVPCSCYIPKNNAFMFNLLFQHLFERFPNAFPILKHLFGF